MASAQLRDTRRRIRSVEATKKITRALLGQKWNRENIELAMLAMANDFQPLTDWRASSEYRTLAAQNLLLRFFLETTTSEPVQLAISAELQ